MLKNKVERSLQLCNLARIMGVNHLIKFNNAHKDILKYARGYMTSYCVSALLNIGFFYNLRKDGKIDLRLYAEENNLDEDVLESVCSYLYSLSILKKDGDFYMIDTKGKMLLELSEGIFDLLHAYGPLFQDLEALLKKEKSYGRDVFRREEFVAKGSAELGHYMPFPIAKNIIKDYGFKNVLDLGCGGAEFLLSLCKDTENLICYGIDISEKAIGYAQRRANAAGKKDKIKLEVCSIFELDGIARRWYDIDVLTSMYVLHEFLYEGREKVLGLLRGIKKNFPGRYLIVCELCRRSFESLRKKPTGIVEHHLFHALSNQGVITFEEWEELFKEADYKIAETRRFDFAEQGYFVLR